MRLAGVVFLACVSSASATLANCLPTKEFSSLYGSPYVYLQTPATAVNTHASMVGRFWQPGAYASTGEQGCPDTVWLGQVSAHTWYINGTLGAAGCSTTGCPSGEMIVSLEDRSTDGLQAFFTVGRVDETSFFPEFDFSRTGEDWNLVPFPRPQGGPGTTGEVFYWPFSISDPAPGFHGLPGAQPQNTITAFLLYRTTPGGAQTRERSAWTFVERYPYAGGATSGVATLVCPPLASGLLYVAAAIEFDHGQVISHHVSGAFPVECDTYQAGAGAVDDGGADGLFVRREATGELTLSWGASCLEGDRVSGGYEIYEGELGEWQSHTPRTCSIDHPQVSHTFLPAGFDAYYLVVPYEDQYEGSYGERSDRSQRPLGASVCRQRLINVCTP